MLLRCPLTYESVIEFRHLCPSRQVLALPGLYGGLAQHACLKVVKSSFFSPETVIDQWERRFAGSLMELDVYRGLASWVHSHSSRDVSLYKAGQALCMLGELVFKEVCLCKSS